MVGMPSAEATASNRDGSPGRFLESASMMAVESISCRTAWRRRLGGHSLLIDLFLELDDAVDERLGARWATRREHLDRHHLVDALDDGVVVEHATHRGAGAHRNHPLGLRHLVVDAPQRGRHL